MPWKECHIVEERLRFIARLLDGEKRLEVESIRVERHKSECGRRSVEVCKGYSRKTVRCICAIPRY